MIDRGLAVAGRPSETQCVVLWCSGYHVCLTRRRSPVRNWAEPCVAAIEVDREVALLAAPEVPSSNSLSPVPFSIAPTAILRVYSQCPLSTSPPPSHCHTPLSPQPPVRPHTNGRMKVHRVAEHRLHAIHLCLSTANSCCRKRGATRLVRPGLEPGSFRV